MKRGGERKPHSYCLRVWALGNFPGGSVEKNLPGNAGDMGIIPDPGRSTCLRETKPVHHSY